MLKYIENKNRCEIKRFLSLTLLLLERKEEKNVSMLLLQQQQKNAHALHC